MEPASTLAWGRVHLARVREQHATKLMFDVRDVEATLAKIEAMGLPLLRRPWGGTEAVDPEGNVFAVRAGT